jgi:hypothetical protein
MPAAVDLYGGSHAAEKSARGLFQSEFSVVGGVARADLQLFFERGENVAGAGYDAGQGCAYTDNRIAGLFDSQLGV